MPIRVVPLTGDIVRDYESPFLGPVDHTVGIQIDLSALTDDEIDAKGYLKPGIPFQKDGTLVGAGDRLFGVTVEEVKVADDNEAGTIAALTTQEVAVGTEGTIVQDVAEDMLGRAYTADEVTAFADSRITLV